MEKVIKKICPPVSELSSINNNLQCNEPGCTKIFKNSSNLNLHLLKFHKIENKALKKRSKDEIIQYHCPAENCLYGINSNRFFQQMKYLKQHYLKVHAEKCFQCEKCSQGFSTECALNRHLPICGITFLCSCNHEYRSYEALLHHSNRTGHFINKRVKSNGRIEPPVVEFIEISNIDQESVSTVAVPVFLAAVALSELSNACSSKSLDMAVQTEPSVLGKKTLKSSTLKISNNGTKKGTSQQTQTGIIPRNIRPKISTQTQTIGDYVLKSDTTLPSTSIPFQDKSYTPAKKRRKSMETQTTIALKQAHEINHPHFSQHNTSNFASLQQFSSSTSYDINIDSGLPDLWIGHKNSSATQTSPLKNSLDQEMLNSVTQTDINLSAFFESESNEQSTSYIHSSSQTVQLSSCFEDSSNGCFGLNSTNPNYELVNRDFERFEDPRYSCSQMDQILTKHKKYVFDDNRSCSIETQTELDSLLTECGTEEDEDTSFTLSSNIETQTTEDISTLDQLIYSNMCTQTCDEILFSDLGFVDIQTQTAFSEYGEDSVFVSTETQTALSGTTTTSTWTSSEMSHMETQTDEFRELIAELEKQNTSSQLL